jgi:hypothetical protein
VYISLVPSVAGPLPEPAAERWNKGGGGMHLLSGFNGYIASQLKFFPLFFTAAKMSPTK